MLEFGGGGNATIDKIIRIINSLIVLIKEIDEADDDSFALSRLSSHPIENFIGRIRSLYHNNILFCNILHNVAQYEIIVRDFDTCHLKFKPLHSIPTLPFWWNLCESKW